jgi:hypothetical protein
LPTALASYLALSLASVIFLLPLASANGQKAKKFVALATSTMRQQMQKVMWLKPQDR